MFASFFAVFSYSFLFTSSNFKNEKGTYLPAAFFRHNFSVLRAKGKTEKKGKHTHPCRSERHSHSAKLGTVNLAHVGRLQPTVEVVMCFFFSSTDYSHQSIDRRVHRNSVAPVDFNLVIQLHQSTNNDFLVVECVVSSFQEAFRLIDLPRMYGIMSGFLTVPNAIFESSYSKDS